MKHFAAIPFVHHLQEIQACGMRHAACGMGHAVRMRFAHIMFYADEAGIKQDLRRRRHLRRIHASAHQRINPIFVAGDTYISYALCTLHFAICTFTKDRREATPELLIANC